VINTAKEALAEKVEQVGEESWQPFERSILLQSIDTQWRGHLLAMDHLRQGIHLRGYAQRDPRQEYKREAFELFAEMLDRIRDEVIKVLLTVRIRPAQEAEQPPLQQAVGSGINVRYQHADYDAALGQQAAAGGGNPGQAAAQPTPGAAAAAAAAGGGGGDTVPRVGRNAPCPCGSGKKYKHCHGRLT